jgi:flavin-dependent dehydrogenase
VLVGDAAGLAERESGEGIGPAVESARAAATAIIEAKGRYATEDLQQYGHWVKAHALPPGPLASLRARVPAFVGRALLRSPAFARLVIERWFLRAPVADALPQRVIHTRPSWRM